ncbi:MAG: TonB-dependent receptor [Acidobacteriia bacterium]|nr:TonB-dependent receptor [Terriglobia bacterium]
MSHGPRPCCLHILLLFLLTFFSESTYSQDAALGTLRGTVSDASGARVPQATVTAVNSGTAVQRAVTTGDDGGFAIQFLPPGQYEVRIEAAGMAPEVRKGVRVEVGAVVELHARLHVAGPREAVTISGEPGAVETQASAVSSVIDSRAISELPLNGRRFTDLVLLTPGVTQDPRGLTSTSVGDLSFGGVRGYNSSFLVDGLDNNNAFFTQARGRYRAPYQFSNEVVQEFRVSSNTYGAELGRSGGAVVNVVTKSGTNNYHGTAFWYLRDGSLSAQHPFSDIKPPSRQNQFGVTVGGPIRKNGVFFYAGFDQHIYHVPTVVYFWNGKATVTPTPDDYEASDRDLVFATAGQLSQMGGPWAAAMVGNTGFMKVDWALSPRNYLVARLSTSRYWGQNNVFLDGSSPITHYATSENGEERVSTESASLSLTSALSFHLTSNLKAQFSRDLQTSDPNSSDVRTSIYDVIEAFGRSSILPRNTREHRIHLVETLTLDGRRHAWKFGADFSQAWVENFFPLMSGGEYLFDNTRVNPFTFKPMTLGMEITPLRAYAHGVPRYYIQDFGDAVTHPDTREYALFAQDTIRVTDHLALTLGVRYDLQTFRSSGLVANPLWPGSGQVPTDSNNVAPRVGFAYSIGDQKPVVIRGGFGLFYTRIPQIYNSAVELYNGLERQHLFLRNTPNGEAAVFPSYPTPVSVCAAAATSCPAPDNMAAYLTSEISAFAQDFRTPVVQQGSLTVEKEIWRRFAIGAAYLYVSGRNLIRARDMNLPEPMVVQYPVFDESTAFTGDYYPVASFATWQMTPSFDCKWPPCLNDVVRPVPSLAAINVFESAATSIYHGLTISARRRMTSGFYFRLAYTWARASDNGQDALLVGRPPAVQNTYQPQAEWGPSVTDQRNRLAVSWVWEPKPFHRDQPFLKSLFNDWRVSGVLSLGSGRPVNAQVVGDANGDQNTANDRLPGYGRNAFTGPDYATTDLRLARRFFLGSRLKLEALAEAFNVFNRTNNRVTVTDDGFLNSAAEFVPFDTAAGGSHYPGYYVKSSTFLQPTDAYAPRQVQFAVKLIF